MVDTFTPANDPSIQTSKNVEFKWLQAEFGDGYSQRSGDGLNKTKRTYNVTIEALLSTEADDIETFFDARGDGTAFYYTFPGEVTQRKFTCQKYGRTSPQGSLFNITAEFKEVFDL